MSVYTDSIIFSSIVIGPNSTIIISASKVIKSLDAEHPLGHLDWISKSVFKVLPQSQKVYKQEGYVWYPKDIFLQTLRRICQMPLQQQFSTFLSHGSHKLVIKILQLTKNVYFCWSDPKIGINLIHAPQTAIVVLAVVVFIMDNLREKSSVPLTKQSGIHVFKLLTAHQGVPCSSTITFEYCY